MIDIIVIIAGMTLIVCMKIFFKWMETHDERTNRKDKKTDKNR